MLGEAAAATGGELRGGDGRRLLRRVTTDSRDVRAGDLFVCLEGPRFDGHDFAAGALASGAAAVVSHRDLVDIRPVIRVADTLAALGALGRHVREQLAAVGEALVVGVTGTNGKTTTKDLTAAALGARWPTVSSRRSFNNAIGVPLTLLDMTAQTRAVVVEMGTNHPGEIRQLASLCEPDVGIITNVQPGHLAGLLSLEGVREEKGCLLEALSGRQVAILNRDDPSFDALARRAPGPVIGFGLSPAAEVRATDVRCDGKGTRFLVGGSLEVTLQLFGRHTVSNALAAIACACVAGVDQRAAAAALGAVPPVAGRFAVRRLGEITVIDDSYNANPGSLAAALAAVAELRLPGRLVLVVGDMLELGSRSAELHEEAGRQVGAAGPAVVLAVGDQAGHLLSGARQAGLPARALHGVRTCDAAAAVLAAELRPGDVVLLKGSRGVALDRLVSSLTDVSARVA